MFGTSFFADNVAANTGIGGIDTYTKLMLHMDGANAGTTFTDSSLTPKTITPLGEATTSTVDFKFATASLLTSTIGGLSTPAHADFNLGTSDFTVDFWINPTSLAGTNEGLYNQVTNGTDFTTLYLNSNGAIQYRDFESNADQVTLTTGAGAIVTGSWQHIALVRNGNNWNIYVNGTSQASTTNAHSVATFTGSFQIGYVSGYTNPVVGYVDEFRWSKGIARWTSNFTPPASAYTT